MKNPRVTHKYVTGICRYVDLSIDISKQGMATAAGECQKIRKRRFIVQFVKASV